MTLGQFAVVVGAPARWVQNAFQALGLPPVYTEELARRLSFAKAVKDACGMPLRRAFPMAADALARWPAEHTWELRGPAGAVVVSLDLERFLSSFYTRLSLARCRYAEKRRGRPRKRTLRGIGLAKWYGVDLTLLEASLQLTPEERLRRLDANVEFLRSVEVLGP